MVLADGCRGLSRVRLRGMPAVMFASAALVLTSATMTASAMAPAAPTLVKDDPPLIEGAPTSAGSWFGWTQNTLTRPDHYDFYAQRQGQSPVKVNPGGTQARTGAVERGRVIYLQGHVPKGAGRLFRLDLTTGKRTLLPVRVQRSRPVWLMGVTSSWPWLLYTGAHFGSDGAYVTPMLYNRRTGQLRQLGPRGRPSAKYGADSFAGQVNGHYATWGRPHFGAGYGGFGQTIYLCDTKTHTSTRVIRWGTKWRRMDPAVSADGTVYYVQMIDANPTTTQLVRKPIDGPPVVIATLNGSAGETFVRDRPDGSHTIFFSWNDGIYQVLDPQAA